MEKQTIETLRNELVKLEDFLLQLDRESTGRVQMAPDLRKKLWERAISVREVINKS